MTRAGQIETLKEGDRFDDVFLVKEVRKAETRAGKPYLILTLGDKSGELGGPLWEVDEKLINTCQRGHFVRASGSVQSYREKLQLKIEMIQIVDSSKIDMADFMITSPKDISHMADELQELIRTVGEPHLRKLLNHFFKQGELWQQFQQSPAAKGIHHAYVGGLLEHSLSVAKMADMASFHYESVDRSLLIAGALLHDIGKLEELGIEKGVVEYSDTGRLKGHLVIGSEMVGRVAAEIPDFPVQLLEKLQHIILSHHGRLEFGSPAVPMTVESMIICFMDDLDAKMNLMEQVRRKMDGNEYSWTEYQRSLERYLFLNGLDSLDKPATPIDGRQRQQRLF